MTCEPPIIEMAYAIRRAKAATVFPEIGALGGRPEALGQPEALSYVRVELPDGRVAEWFVEAGAWWGRRADGRMSFGKGNAGAFVAWFAAISASPPPA
mgnify:FL=1